jgi:hypothetical protein
MTIICSLGLAALEIILANPLVFIYLGQAVLHALAALCYLKHEGGRPLALCHAVMAVLYVIAAFQHGVTH